MVEEALRLARETTPEEAAKRLKGRGVKGASARSIRLWQEKHKVILPVPPPPAKPGTEATLAPVVAEPPPPGLSPRALRRWHIEQQIAAVRTALALAERSVAAGDTTALSRIGPLNTQLRAWLEALAELEGPEREDPDAERHRWRAAADRVLDRIRAGLAGKVVTA